MYLLALVYLHLAFSASQQHNCPYRCGSCTQNMADCSNQRMVAPPRDFPADIKTILLNDNNIRVIGSRTFRQMNSLEILKISNNRIASLRQKAFRSFPNLRQLDLRENRISRIFPQALHNMPELRTLSLEGNRIRSVSGVFRGTPNLYHLNMGNNRISRIGKRDLRELTRAHYLDFRSNRISNIHPEAFSQLELLRYLFLNKNPITRLQGLQFGSSVLQQVDLSHCQLEKVPSRFPASITDLRLGHNKITNIEHDDFYNITDLTLLTLNNNELVFIADRALYHLHDLEEVWLRHNKLVYIPRGLPHSLRKLHMGSNDLQQLEANIFSNNSRIEHLTFESNQISTLEPNTFKNLRFLNTLDLQNNQLRSLKSRSFSRLNSLNSLLLSNNPLERFQSQAFQNLGNLSELYLNHLTSERFQLDYNFLQGMLSLEKMQLQNSPGLAEALMDVLDDRNELATSQRLHSLIELDLTYNTLEFISPYVQQWFPNLQSILLDGNPLWCNYRLRWLKRWMRTAADRVHFFTQTEPVCEGPASVLGRTIPNLADNEWQQETNNRQLNARQRTNNRRGSLRNSR